jgi:hypothetical protein
MRVLKLTLGKIFFLQIFPQFLSFHCEASEWSLLASERVWLKRPDSKITRSDAGGLSHAYRATRVRTD